jgi:hypothetical protein
LLGFTNSPWTGRESAAAGREMHMEIGKLNGMVAEDAAVRRCQMLQPVGGKGDKIFPPTYPGEWRNAPPRHVYERRRLNGADIWCPGRQRAVSSQST